MKKLLVTGASGFLGWNICNAAVGSWDIYGTYFTHSLTIRGTKTIRIDLRDFMELKKIFHAIRPDAVIHSAAKADLNYCQENRSETERINITASINIAGLCSDYGIPCVFISTDVVFDGEKPPYSEDDKVSPVNFYGGQKVLAEEEMSVRYPETIICRMPLMFGIPGPVASSFLQPTILAMKEGRELTLFVDEIRTPVSGGTAAKGILLALRKFKGIVHMGGPERISRYDFGRLLARVSGISGTKLIPCSQKDIVMSAPRPRDVSLDSSKAFQSGFKPPPLEEELRHLIL
jgi:dTDP-4-dehydrorhamnose reductase